MSIIEQKADEIVVPARCPGDHYFENICRDCGNAQPSGPCAVCPHMPGSHPAEHFIRRPCTRCDGINLTTVRVRVPG